jgi:2-haloacid dehalogenase
MESNMPRVILFDVNETLLDLRALNPQFEQIFGDSRVTSQWFSQLLRSALVATVTNTYHDFETLARDALDMVAVRHGITLSARSRSGVLDGMRRLPPHPEVADSLHRLRSAGLRLATLTNSPPSVLHEQLTNSGLIDLFEQTLSVDPTRRFKPAPETYRYAAQELGVDVNELRLVAAHDWDIAGAMRAGCAGAFVARPGMVLGPLQERPDIIGADLRSVADRILKAEFI